MKKTKALILASATSLAVLSGCGKTDTKTEDQASPEQATQIETTSAGSNVTKNESNSKQPISEPAKTTTVQTSSKAEDNALRQPSIENKVRIVKNSTMPGYPQLTIESAFSNAFPDHLWDYRVEKGRQLVYFYGVISEETHDTATSKFYKGAYKHFPKYKQMLKDLKDKYNDEYYAKYKELRNTLARDVNIASKNYRAATSKSEEKRLTTIWGKLNSCLTYFPDFKRHHPDLYKKYRVHELDEASARLKLKQKNIEAEVIKKFNDEMIWPVGSDVVFEWVIYPNGRNIELTAFSNDSWEKINTNLPHILSIIYSY